MEKLRRPAIIVRSAAVVGAALLLAAAGSAPLTAGRLVHAGEIWCQDGVIDREDLARVLRAVGTQCDASEPCPEDLNGNGEVGASDAMIVASHVGSSCLHGDTNGDGAVDLADVVTVLTAVGRDCRADLDGDGTVTVLDLAHAEMAFGPAPDGHPASAGVRGNPCGLGADDLIGILDLLGTDCRVDQDKNGVVDGCDANIVCEETGLCPPAIAECEPFEPPECMYP